MVYIVTIMRRSFDLKSITVEPVMFIYMFNSFQNFVTFQALVYDKVCVQNFNSTVCAHLNNNTFYDQEDVVQKQTSTWLLYSNIAMGVPALLTVMFLLGPWGDRLGRKLPVVVPQIGTIVGSIANLINSVYMDAPLGYLLIGNFLNGLCGGYIGALMSMYTYIAHVSTPEYRTIKMGVLEAMVFLSGTVGTGVSGVMLDRTSYQFVFGFLSGLLTLGLVYTLLWVDNVIPEKSKEAPTSIGWCTILMGVVKDVTLCVWNNRRSKQFWNLALLIVVLFLVMLVTVGEYMM